MLYRTVLDGALDAEALVRASGDHHAYAAIMHRLSQTVTMQADAATPHPALNVTLRTHLRAEGLGYMRRAS